MNLKKLKWSCDDYLRDDGDKYCWLMNSQWEVIPTIDFIDATMKVLTCKDYDVGDARMMIHACRWKHHLPSDQPDQI